MEIKKISEKNNITRLLVKGSDIAMMNAVRRAVLNSVPTLAIEDVSIYENSSVLFDEYLAHRLAMVPIKTDLKRHKPGDKVKMLLEKEGPATVYSRDLKSTDPRAEAVSKGIPLVKLNKGQKIKMEMQAVMGTGKVHAKWQPAAIGYRELPIIAANKNCDLCGKCVEACARKLLEMKAKKIELKDVLECDLCGKCRDACEKGALDLDYECSSFLLVIDNHGNLKINEMLLKAVEALDEKNKEFARLMKKE